MTANAPINERNVSVLLIPEDDVDGMSEATPRQIVAESVALMGTDYHLVTSADMDGLGGTAQGMVFEALNGNCKGQLTWILAFEDTNNVAQCTRFLQDTCTSTRFRLWQTNMRLAAATSAGTTATVISTYRTEASDIFSGQNRMLGLYGANEGDQVAISSFTPGSDQFGVGAMTAASRRGDLYAPVTPLVSSLFQSTIPTTMIAREVVGDSLDGQGAVVGAQQDIVAEMVSDVRGLDAEAGAGVAAVAPPEAAMALQAVFNEELGTGDTTQAGSSAVLVNVSDGTRFNQYGLAMSAEGDIFGISSIATNALTVPAAHLNAAPDTGDIVYGGVVYKPKSTGHGSVAALIYRDRKLANLLLGGVPEVKLSLTGNALAKLTMGYSFAQGLELHLLQTHDDTYSSGMPVPVKSNIGRVVIDGAEISDGDVLGAELMLQSAPSRKNTAFGAAENNGGNFYAAERGAGGTLNLYMVNNEWANRVRTGDTFDILIQVGRQPTEAFALWAPKCQVIASPEKASADNFLTLGLTLAFLRPNEAGRPAYTLGIF